MNTLLHWLTSPEWALVVKTLLHSLWQGAVIAVGLALLLRKVAGPEARYRIAVAGLGAVLLSAMITWGVLNVPKQSAAPVAPMSELSEAVSPVATGPVKKIVVAANWTPARQQTQWTAWLALAWLLGASAMLGRASVKVAGAEQLRRSCQPLTDSRIAELVAEARRAVKLTRQVRVAVTNQLTSPAVVGVLVPTLILPLSLVTTLSPAQLRFILLHELAHIRRGDYLANLFQLFAEALLFFNPAVWWLSHQIRREREACCDALAIELSGAPADYARTLVSVAETMLNPSPSAAPAFGNEREPSSLADRVQRVLVPGYRPSLRLTWRAMLAALAAGGVLLGLLAAGTRETVAATAALLEPKSISTQSNIDLSTPDSGYGMWQHELAIVGQTNRRESVAVLLREVEQSSFADAYVAWRQENKALAGQRGSNVGYSIPSGVTDSKFTPSRIAALQCRLGQEAHLHEPFLLRELAADAEVHMILESSPRLCEKYGIFSMAPVRFIPGQGYTSRMNNGYSPQLQQALWLKAMTNASPQANGSANGSQPIPSETNQTPSNGKTSTNSPAESFSSLSKPEAASSTGAAANPTTTINPATGLSEGGGTNLHTRTFRVDANEFAQALGMVGPVATTNFGMAVREFFATVGVDLRLPGKTTFYKDRTGLLLVRATLQDLDNIEKVLQVMNAKPPQVNIRAKFVEVPEKQASALLANATTTTNLEGQITGILTEPQAKALFKSLEQSKGVDILSAPDVTTLSGRQAQLQVVDIRTIVTGVSSVTATNGANTNLFQTSALPFGPVLDVVPYVSADGFTVQMVLIPTVTEFIGYDEPASSLTKFAQEKSLSSELPLPRFRVRQATTTAVVRDGQTIVIGGFISETVTQHPDGSKTRKPDPKEEKKHLFVFITPTIIDPAGNRVHTDDVMPPDAKAAPKQTPAK